MRRLLLLGREKIYLGGEILTFVAPDPLAEGSR